MQPLKILAATIGTLPLAAFLVTLALTDGAPLQPFTPGQESGPAAATPTLPQAERVRPGTERQDNVAAAGQRGTGAVVSEIWAPEAASPTQRRQEPILMVNSEREAQLYLILFGAPEPYYPPAP